MAKPTRQGSKRVKDLPSRGLDEEWLRRQPLQWSSVIAARGALRMLPVTPFFDELEDILSVFRATAVALFSAKYPNSALGFAFVDRAQNAVAAAVDVPGDVAQAASAAARVAANVSAARTSRSQAAPAHTAASEAISAALSAAARVQVEIEFFEALNQDLELSTGRLELEKAGRYASLA